VREQKRTPNALLFNLTVQLYLLYTRSALSYEVNTMLALI